jgi:hypothetical protein
MIDYLFRVYGWSDLAYLLVLLLSVRTVILLRFLFRCWLLVILSTGTGESFYIFLLLVLVQYVVPFLLMEVKSTIILPVTRVAY